MNGPNPTLRPEEDPHQTLSSEVIRFAPWTGAILIDSWIFPATWEVGHGGGNFEIRLQRSELGILSIRVAGVTRLAFYRKDDLHKGYMVRNARLPVVEGWADVHWEKGREGADAMTPLQGTFEWKPSVEVEVELKLDAASLTRGLAEANRA